MFHRKQTTQTQDEAVALQMTRFFERLSQRDRADPERIAKLYAKRLRKSGSGSLLAREKLASRSRFHVALSVADGDLDQITKRASLVSDTLLLSHDRGSKFHEFDSKGGTASKVIYPTAVMLASDLQVATLYGLHCPDLAELGNWFIDAEPLLRKGLVWYLPSYSTVDERMNCEPDRRRGAPEQETVMDFLVHDERVVDFSGVDPLKSRLIRPILSVDLPFIDGVSLREFSRITAGEFDSYSAFRDFLRLRLLSLDDAMNSVQSEHELLKIGVEIKDQIRSMRASMVKVKSTRRMYLSTLAISSAQAMLVAVEKQHLVAAIGMIGATGGLWSFMKDIEATKVSRLKDDKWYYVWVLSKNAGA